jgi:hypothetical protein
VICGAGGQVELGEDARHVLLDGAQRDEELVRDRLVRTSLGHKLQHLALSRRQLLQRIVAPPATEQLADDVGVEHRASLGDPPHR